MSVLVDIEVLLFSFTVSINAKFLFYYILQFCIQGYLVKLGAQPILKCRTPKLHVHVLQDYVMELVLENLQKFQRPKLKGKQFPPGTLPFQKIWIP